MLSVSKRELVRLTQEVQKLCDANHWRFPREFDLVLVQMLGGDLTASEKLEIRTIVTNRIGKKYLRRLEAKIGRKDIRVVGAIKPKDRRRANVGQDWMLRYYGNGDS
jgi:hypothetical protein